MSVENMGNGALRLACDGEWCSRKFSPRRHFTTERPLRDHAINYGWLTKPAAQKQPSIPGVDDPKRKLLDLCPDCRRAAAA